jgi:hypothetical protein
MYCNRADTHWYTMDKATPPDHRKPPKQAQFPDAPGLARTCASKLVAGAGQRFESARRLSFLVHLQDNRKTGEAQARALGGPYTNPYTNGGNHPGSCDSSVRWEPPRGSEARQKRVKPRRGRRTHLCHPGGSNRTSIEEPLRGGPDSSRRSRLCSRSTRPGRTYA